MTSENRDIHDAVAFVQGVMKIVTDPTMPGKLRLLEAALKDSVNRAVGEPPEAEMKTAVRGTCPTCGREYGIKQNGALRRHGTGHCYMFDQLPQEIIPAVFLLADLGNAPEGTSYGEDNGGTGKS